MRANMSALTDKRLSDPDHMQLASMMIYDLLWSLLPNQGRLWIHFLKAPVQLKARGQVVRTRYGFGSKSVAARMLVMATVISSGVLTVQASAGASLPVENDVPAHIRVIEAVKAY